MEVVPSIAVPVEKKLFAKYCVNCNQVLRVIDLALKFLHWKGKKDVRLQEGVAEGKGLSSWSERDAPTMFKVSSPVTSITFVPKISASLCPPSIARL